MQSESWQAIYDNLIVIVDGCAWTTYGDKDIILVQMTSTTHEAIDAWIELSAKIRKEWDKDAPILVLVDAMRVNFLLSPYARKRGGEMLAINTDARTYIAYLTRQSVTTKLLNTILATTSIVYKHIISQIFYDVTSAHHWLVQMDAEYLADKQ